MKVRSITYFCNPGWPLNDSIIDQAGEFLAEAKAAYEEAGYQVQSTRLATVPFLQILGADRIAETPRLTEEMAAAIQAVGIANAALGPAQPEVMDSFAVIPEAIAAAQSIFFLRHDGRCQVWNFASGRAGLCGSHHALRHHHTRRFRQPALCGAGKCQVRITVLPGGLPQSG